jgi:Ni,Fe-hydrogenase III small subunit
MTLAPSDAALFMAHQAHETAPDPAMTFVVAMTAAAITGHIIERTREQMHATLDQVFDVAMAKMLEATETKQ